MKTTIKISALNAITVQPWDKVPGGVILSANLGGVLLHLTPDQAGALLFGLEQAATVGSPDTLNDKG